MVHEAIIQDEEAFKPPIVGTWLVPVAILPIVLLYFANTFLDVSFIFIKAIQLCLIAISQTSVASQPLELLDGPDLGIYPIQILV